MTIKDMFLEANELANQGKVFPALEITATLLQHYPDDARYVALAGKIFANMRYYGVAMPLMKQALEMLPKGEKYNLSRAEYLNNMGFCARFLNKHEDGRRYYKQAIKYADGHAPDIYGNLAALYVARGESEQGLEYIQKALDADPTDENAKNNKAVLLLEQGKYAEGFALYDARMVLKEEGKKWKNYPGSPPLWDGTKGQTVIVYGEQGIGDEIMFASLLPQLSKDCNVIFDCNDRLLKLFRSSFDIPIYGTKREDETKLEWVKRYKVDAMIPIGSLAKFYPFAPTPYITKPKPHARLEGLKRKKIGISWLGGSVDTHCWERHIPIEKLETLLELDADFVSLQYDDKATEEVKKSGLNIHHWPDILHDKDYSVTGSLVAGLDLVVSVPQSVVHLAGSMGVPTWQLTPKRAMWQMGVYGHDMPWYGCVKSYWQQDGWDDVLTRVKGDLCSFLTNTAN